MDGPWLTSKYNIEHAMTGIDKIRKNKDENGVFSSRLFEQKWSANQIKIYNFYDR